MRYILVVILGVVLSYSLLAQNYSYEVDQWDSKKTNILNEYGDIIGYYKRDQWDVNVINLHDVNGNVINSIKADQWDVGRTNYYNQHGNLEGSKKRDQWNPNRTNLYDDEGNIIGYKEPDQWNTGRINRYNSHGTLEGYYERDQWTGNLGFHETPNGRTSKLNIYSTEGMKSVPNVEFQPTLDYSQLDLSPLSDAVDNYARAMEQRRAFVTQRLEAAKTEEERQAIIQSYFNSNSKKVVKPKRLDSATRIEMEGKDKIIHFPKVDKYDSQNIQITKVELKRKETIIHIRYINDGSGWVNINNTACIYDKKEMNKIDDVNKALKIVKSIRDSENIPFAPNKHYLKKNYEILEFSLEFPKIDWRKTELIDLLECQESSCFNVYGIHLN